MTLEKTALLIDVEHLVAGLTPPGREVDGVGLDPPLDPQALVGLAGTEGPLALARAYADWRLPAHALQRAALEAAGVAAVQVGGPRGAATVAVRLSVDATALAYERPEVATFVLVGATRELTPLVQQLRARGRRVVGVCPARGVDGPLAAACDRFFTYASARQAAHDEDALDEGLRRLKARIALLVADHAGPDGLPGSRLKPLIRRHIAPGFDEADYGYTKFSALLRAMPDAVRLEQPDDRGDVYVFPVLAPRAAAVAARQSETAHDPLALAVARFVGLARERLIQWRYEWDRVRRHALLAEIHRTMVALAPFTQDDIVRAVREGPLGRHEALSATLVARHLAVCYQSAMFDVDPRDGDRPVRARHLALREPYTEFDAFVARYEQSILYKLGALLPDDPAQATRFACAVLGLEPSDRPRTTYVVTLLRRARD